MLLVANFANYTKLMQKSWKMTEPLAYGYSSESTQWELSNEYQHCMFKWFLETGTVTLDIGEVIEFQSPWLLRKWFVGAQEANWWIDITR